MSNWQRTGPGVTQIEKIKDMCIYLSIPPVAYTHCTELGTGSLSLCIFVCYLHITIRATPIQKKVRKKERKKKNKKKKEKRKKEKKKIERTKESKK